jgi:hypothetical protein
LDGFFWGWPVEVAFAATARKKTGEGGEKQHKNDSDVKFLSPTELHVEKSLYE